MTFEFTIAVIVGFIVLGVFALERAGRRIQEDLRARQEDIEVLRIAVFNHLRHGGDPVEGHIREVLGYGARE